MHRPLLVLVAALAFSSFVGCATTDNLVPVKEVELEADGLPIWVDQPCAGLPVGALCAVAESSLAAADVEAGKVDAETSCKNRLAEQVSAKIGRLTERLASAAKDLGTGRTYGERTLKDINQNFEQTELHGIRYSDYFFTPDRLAPTKVYVRAVITVDSNKLSQEIVAAMMRGAEADKLEFKHEEAQARFDAVRAAYLAEEKATADAAAP